MSTPDPGNPVGQTGEEVVVKFALGDAGGDNGKLARALQAVADQMGKDAPGTGGYRLLEWLKRCGDPFVWCATKVPPALRWVADQFTDRQVKLIKAEAEAEKTRAEAEEIRARAEVARKKGEAEAKLIDAQAAEKQADADRKKVEVQAMRAKRRSAASIAKELKARGIDWAVEVGDDGVLRIAPRKLAGLTDGDGTGEPEDE